MAVVPNVPVNTVDVHGEVTFLGEAGSAAADVPNLLVYAQVMAGEVLLPREGGSAVAGVSSKTLGGYAS